MGMEASGAEIGAKKLDEIAKTPEELLAVKENWYGKDLWEKKFSTWVSIIRKPCPAKDGPGGRYCLWVGFACNYNGCPQRIFEQYVPTREIPRPEPTPDFVAEFNVMKNQVAKLGRRLKKSNERIKELEDEKKGE